MTITNTCAASEGAVVNSIVLNEFSFSSSGSYSQGRFAVLPLHTSTTATKVVRLGVGNLECVCA